MAAYEGHPDCLVCWSGDTPCADHETAELRRLLEQSRSIAARLDDYSGQTEACADVHPSRAEPCYPCSTRRALTDDA